MNVLRVMSLIASLIEFEAFKGGTTPECGHNEFYFFLFEILCVRIRSTTIAALIRIYERNRKLSRIFSLSFALNENKFNVLITSINKEQDLIQRLLTTGIN